MLQVRAWLEETYLGVSSCILSYHVGRDSLQVFSSHESALANPVTNEVRLRMDGLFEKQASKFIQEFEALYTNDPAGGGGIRSVNQEHVHRRASTGILNSDKCSKWCSRMLERVILKSRCWPPLTEQGLTMSYFYINLWYELYSHRQLFHVHAAHSSCSQPRGILLF